MARLGRGGPVARLRAHAGLWVLVAALGGATVFVTAGAQPVTTSIEDQALRQAVEQAPAGVRDITLHWPTAIQNQPDSAAAALASVDRRLPDDLRHEHAPAWGVQHTRPLAVGGEGVSAEPHGWAPVVDVVHQTGLVDEVTMVEGALPVSTGSRVEVMAAAPVAAELGLRVGQEYVLAAGPIDAKTMRPDAVLTSRDQTTVRLSGVFDPTDPGAPAWETRRELREPFLTGVPAIPPELTLRAALVTDQTGMAALYTHSSVLAFQPATLARVRLDADQLDAAWVDRATKALAQLRTSPANADVRVRTGLDDLLADFTRQAAASRAVIAVVAAGIVACGVGLLVLAARLALARRHRELVLLRARGGSVARLVAGLAAEAALVTVPAVAVAWLLRLLLQQPVTAGSLAGTVLVSAVAVLVVPVVAAFAHRQVRLVERRADVSVSRAGPARLTVEASVVLLAGAGIWLVQWRGLHLAGVDPYLSAVPALAGTAAGLLALRLYRWPLRGLAALTGRRGAVTFLGMARAGRAAPVAALPVVVLVLAVAVGGFAGTLQSGVTAARDVAALEAVGAHGHVSTAADTPLPDQVVDAVARLPGVTQVAAAHSGVVRTESTLGTTVRAVAVDTTAYGRVLAAAGGPALPDDFVSGAGAEAGSAAGADEPLPALASSRLARYAPLRVSFDGQDYPVTLVGDVAQLPGPGYGDDVVLVPRELVPDLAPDTLWIAGTAVDGDAVRRVVGAEPAVTTMSEWRADLDESAFNQMFTVVFVAGTAAAAAAALLVIALAMVTQAPARGQAVSLLRTMGLSLRQARGLLLLELLPLTVLAVAVGGAVGTALPLLLGPALGLAEYTGGVPVVLRLDAVTVGGFAALVGALVVAGVVAQSMANRRLGLGGVLRVQG